MVDVDFTTAVPVPAQVPGLAGGVVPESVQLRISIWSRPSVSYT
jgi:hypothetical protein